MKKTAVIILSGGLDSSTMAYFYKDQGYELLCVSFNYGQKHLKELTSATLIAQQLKAEHQILDLSFMRQHLATSSLVNPALENPKQEYARENMLLTVVPNRNSMMLALAWSLACTANAQILAYGPHRGDDYVYADCRPDYVNAINLALRLGSIDSRHEDLQLEAPFLKLNKTEIVQLGSALQVPFALTWSCYDGAEQHCGLCGTCRQRKQAFKVAQVIDPTQYKE
jgi:7-cyano-7-deazaguanine synthase